MEGVAALGSDVAPTAAGRLFGAAAALRASIWASAFPDDRPAYGEALASVKRGLDPADFDAAWQAGSALSLEEAFDEALALAEMLLGADGRRPGPVLTARQREVLGLLAEGRADKEIAAALGLSRYTASKHVAAIMARLDAPSRTAAVTAGRRAGFL